MILNRRVFAMALAMMALLVVAILYAIALPADETPLFGLTVSVLLTLIVGILLNTTMERVPAYAPWVYYPPMVMVYYLLEPILKKSVISTKDPEGVSVLVAIFITCFLVGVSLVQLQPVRKRNRSNTGFSLHKIFMFSCLMLCMSILVNLYVVAKFGFLPLRPDFEILRTELPQHISGYATYIMYLAMPASILFFAVSTKTNNPSLKKISFALGVISVILPLHTGNRTRFLVGCVTALMVYWSHRKKWPSFAAMTAILALTLIIMGLIGAVRLSSFREGSLFELGVLKLSAELGLASYSMDRIVNGMHGQYLSPVWLIKPFLTLLPGKDVTLVRHLKDILNLQFVGGGFTPTIVGSFYIYGGTTFVAIGGVFYGMLQAGVFRFFVSEQDPDVRYWKSCIFFFNVVYSCVVIKNGFFISIAPVFYFSAIIVPIMLSRYRK